jgi:hypothetical protein
MRLNGLRVLLDSHSFALGLAFGGIAFLVAAIVAATTRRRVPDIAGITFAAAAWLGVRGAWGEQLARSSAAWAFVMLAVGGAVSGLVMTHRADVRRHALLVTALALTPGAIVLALATPLAGSATSRTIFAMSTVALGVALRDFDVFNGRKGAPWLLFAIAAAGAYLAVPDTELARVFLGVALPFVLMSVPYPSAGFGPAGSAAMAGVFTWVVVVGGRGRPGSVVGGLAAIGLLAAEPIGRRLVGRDRALWARVLGRYHRVEDKNRDSWLAAAFFAAVVQSGFVLYASRIVGARDAALAALFVLAPVAALAVFAAPELFPLEREITPRPARSRHRSHRSGHSHRHRRSAARAHR